MENKLCSHMVTGAMPFNQQALGFHPFVFPFAFGSASCAEPSGETTTKIATLQAKLNKRLGPEFISQRPGPGGGPKLTYAEGWKIINLANEVFGFNGWSSSIVNLTTDFVDYSEESRRYNVGVTATVRVMLKDGVYHEDVGYGTLENSKSKGTALDKCKKEAVTDALKRTLRNFGNLLGNCLYDKSYAQEVVKIKVPPAKFDKNDLYRRPESDDMKPSVSLAQQPKSAPAVPVAAAKVNPLREERTVKPESPSEKAEPCIVTYVPRHLRQEMVAVAQETTNTKGTAAGPSEQRSNRLPLDKSNAQRQASFHTPAEPQGQQFMPHTRRYREAEQSPLARQQPQVLQVPFAQNLDDRDNPPVDLPDADKEESYGFNSDDDAFLAAVDLGEGDLGRPIDFEEGLGCVEESIPEQGSRSATTSVIQHGRVRERMESASSSSAGSEPPMRRAAPVANSKASGQPNANISGSTVVQGAGDSTSTKPGVSDKYSIALTSGIMPRASSVKPVVQQPPQKPLGTLQGQRSSVKRSADVMQRNTTNAPMSLHAGGVRQQQHVGMWRQPLANPEPGVNEAFKRTRF